MVPGVEHIFMLGSVLLAFVCAQLLVVSIQPSEENGLVGINVLKDKLIEQVEV